MKRGNLIFNPRAGGSSPETIPNLLSKLEKQDITLAMKPQKLFRM